MSMFPLEIMKVTDKSMEPYLKYGNFIFIDKWGRHFAANDVVVFYHPKKVMLLVKRIIRKDGESFFVEGDNKELSEDSRRFGPVPRGNIVGRVLFKV